MYIWELLILENVIYVISHFSKHDTNQFTKPSLTFFVFLAQLFLKHWSIPKRKTATQVRSTRSFVNSFFIPSQKCYDDILWA